MLRLIGVLALLCASLRADDQPEKTPTFSEKPTEIKEPQQNSISLSPFSLDQFLDLEEILEEFPELQPEFEELSEEEREKLIKAFETFNEALQEALSSLDEKEPESLNSN